MRQFERILVTAILVAFLVFAITLILAAWGVIAYHGCR